MKDMTKNFSKEAIILLVSVFLIAACGIVYELSIGNISSYLLGNSVLQYSLTVGAFMFSMGIGSFLSRYIDNNLLDTFIIIEMVIGLLGGFSAIFLFYAYGFTGVYTACMFIIIGIIGVLIGMEIPILTRLIEERYKNIKLSISNALGFDYIGALVGSILFSIFMLPNIGIIKTSYVLGLINILVVLMNIFVYYKDIKKKRTITALTIIILAGLCVGLANAASSATYLEQKLYKSPIVYIEQTKYQKIVMTKSKEDLRLFLDGNLQFCSVDEARYHEALIHPAASMIKSLNKVLILGGGDGLALREIFKYSTIENVTMVDIDPAITKLARKDSRLLEMNKASMLDKRLTIINNDAYKFLEEDGNLYDFIVVDLPDPNNEALSKLYSNTFYKMIRAHLNTGGFTVIQSTSPFYAKKVYWCIRNTVKSTGLYTTGYHLDVPSFGDWGFTIASNTNFNSMEIELKVNTRYLSSDLAKAMFLFGKDVYLADSSINTLTNPVILNYYDSSWKHWNE